MKYMEVTVTKKSETTCVVAFNERQYDKKKDLAAIMRFACEAVEKARRQYFNDEYPDFEATGSQMIDEPQQDAETMPPPADWLALVTAQVMVEYRDPVEGVRVEPRGGRWRRVVSVGGVNALVEGPLFDLGEYVDDKGALKIGDFEPDASLPVAEAVRKVRAQIMDSLAADFAAAFPGPWTGDEIRARFTSAMGLSS